MKANLNILFTLIYVPLVILLVIVILTLFFI